MGEVESGMGDAEIDGTIFRDITYQLKCTKESGAQLSFQGAITVKGSVQAQIVQFPANAHIDINLTTGRRLYQGWGQRTAHSNDTLQVYMTRLQEAQP